MTDITAMRISNYVSNLLPHTRFDNIHELNAELVTHIATNYSPDERFLVESLLQDNRARELADGISSLTRAIAYIEAQIEMITGAKPGEEKDVIYLPITDTTFMFSNIERTEFDATYEDIKGRYGWVAINSVRNIPAAVQSFMTSLGDKAVGEVEKFFEAAMHNQSTWYVTPEVEGGIDPMQLADAYERAVELVKPYREMFQRNPDYHATFRQVGGDVHVYIRRKVA